MTASEPQAILATLPRADGSATYSHAGYTVTASANGPIEAPRRDEDPDEAVVDVVVRPAAGVGGPSERHLESVLQATLQDLVLVQDFPRCLIQVVLQLQAVPENDYVLTRLNAPGLALGALPALLQGAVLALLAAGIPMRTTATAASVAVVPAAAGGADTLVSSFSPRDAAAARSTHVFAFAAHAGHGSGHSLLLAESEGAFTMDAWDAVRAAAEAVCCGAAADSMALDDGNGPGLGGLLRSTMQGKLESALQWKAAAAQE